MINPKNFTVVTITGAGITRTYPVHGRMNSALNLARRAGQKEISYLSEGRFFIAVFA